MLLIKFLGQYGLFRPTKEKGKIKIKANRKIPTVEELLGERKAKIVIRAIGIVALVLSFVMFISPNTP